MNEGLPVQDTLRCADTLYSWQGGSQAFFAVRKHALQAEDFCQRDLVV